MRLLRFSITEALVSFRRGWRHSVAAVLTVAGAAFVLTLLLWVGHIGRTALDRWRAVAEISVFFSPRATSDQIAQAQHAAEAHPSVASTEVVTAQAARAQLLADFPDARAILDGMTLSGVPASLEVRLVAHASAADDASALVAQLTALPAVDDVRFDRDLIDRVTVAAGVIERVGAVVVLLLLLTSALTVASVVRLAYETRRDEVEIMYLVGAPASTIRGPFAVEGGLQAGLGACLGLAVIAAGALAVEQRLGSLLLSSFGIAHLPYPPLALPVTLVGALCLLGVLSGLWASRGGDGRTVGRTSDVLEATESEPLSPETQTIATDPQTVEADR